MAQRRSVSMLGHLVAVQPSDDGYRTPAGPGLLRRVLNALFARRR